MTDENKNDDNSSNKGEEGSKEGQSTEEKLSNLEKKLGEVSKTIDDQNQFIDAASVVINTLAYTPELREHFQKVVKGKMGGEGDDEQQTKTETEEDKTGDDKSKTETTEKPDDKTTRVVQDVEASQRESIIVQFEKEAGIDKMEPEKQKEARNQISSYLNDFGWSAKTLPLVNLRGSLVKAFEGTIGIQRLKEEGKMEGIVAAKTNSNGIMGQISGVTPPVSEQEKNLSPKQEEWVKKLRVDPEKAKKTYLSKEEEQIREKPEQKEEGK